MRVEREGTVSAIPRRAWKMTSQKGAGTMKQLSTYADTPFLLGTMGCCPDHTEESRQEGL